MGKSKENVKKVNLLCRKVKELVRNPYLFPPKKTKENKMSRTLHLVLKSKWYDKIASGEKTSEYRECKPYWNKRFVGYDFDTTYAYPICVNRDVKHMQIIGVK